MERIIPMDQNAHSDEILKNLNSLRKENIHCDFKIKAGSEEMPVHKVVLSSGSDYFKAMLAHENKESQAGVVVMKQMNPVCVKKCIEFIYTGTGSVSNENREELMHAAHMMQLQRLCNGIAIFLEEDLCAESYVSTKRIATMFSCKKLEECCNKFVLDHFCEIATSNDFTSLEKKDLTFLLRSGNVKASASDKCKALLIWTKHEPSSRVEHFEENFKTLDFPKLNFEYVKYLIENESLIYNSMPCWKSLFAMVMSKYKSKDHEFTGGAYKQNNAIAVFDKSSKSIQCFDPQEKSWRKLQNITDEISAKQFLAVVLGKDMYVLAYDKTNYRLQNYSDTSATWEKLADRAINDRSSSIYAFDDSSNFSKAVEKYDSSVDSWLVLTNKPVPGYECAVVSTKGFIFCIGGIDGRQSVTANQKLDPSIPKWYTAKPMPSGRCYASALALNENIYVMGGTPWGCSLSTVICFNLSSETWTSVANMNHARYNLGSCVLGNKIYVIGGSGSSDTIEEYTPAENTWKVIGNIKGKSTLRETAVALSIPT